MPTEIVLSKKQYNTLVKGINTNLLRSRVVALNSLRNDKYFLKSPIYISVEYSDDKVIASFDDIEVFAYGDTEYEAINLLCIEIVQVFEDLKEDSKNLGELPKTWFSILNDIIQCR